MKKSIVLITLVVILVIGAMRLSQSLPPSVSTTPALVSQAPNAIATPAASSNIEVILPKEEDKVSSPIMITGNARVSENVVSIRLNDNNGDILATDTTSVNSPSADGFGPFEDNLLFNIPQTTEGFLEVYQVSSPNGSEIDKVTIPVKFK